MATPDAHALLPQAVVMQMMHGAFVALMLRAVAELEIADRLAEGPKTTEELAAITKTDAGALGRALRALATLGVVKKDEGARWANTAVGDTLRAGAVGSMREYVRMLPHLGNLKAWSRFDEVLRTGGSTFEAANGCDHWTYLERQPELGRSFHRAMSALTGPMAHHVARAAEVRRFRSILDVGGGAGDLLATLLAHAPAARGAIVDCAAAIDAARVSFAQRDLLDRVDLVAGDMFGALPSGHDAHVMKHVLHDWDDDRALALLRRSREALAPDGRLLVVEAVLPEGDERHAATLLDLHMLTVLGGKERTESEWSALLAAAGYRLLSTRSLPAVASVLEAASA